MSGLRVLYLLEIKTTAVTRLLSLLPAFPLLEEVTVLHTHAFVPSPETETTIITAIIQQAYDDFIDELAEMGVLGLPFQKTLVGLGYPKRRWQWSQKSCRGAILGWARLAPALKLLLS